MDEVPPPSSGTCEPRPRCVLIGPPATGKSTVAPLVASPLRSPWVDLDEIASPYYAEAGWSPAMLSYLPSELGWERFHASCEPALIHAVERCIQEHPGAVVALGAGHTHPTDPSLRPRVAQALKGAFVVLLRPTPDTNRPVQIGQVPSSGCSYCCQAASGGLICSRMAVARASSSGSARVPISSRRSRW